MIRPIKSPADLAAAKKRLSKLIEANETGAHDDEIDILATLIEQFERTVVTLEAPSPIAAIRFRMEQMGLTPRQLEPFIGSRARVSEVLSGKRRLSIDMIRSLHEGLGIPYESLIAKRHPSVGTVTASASALDELIELGVDLDKDDVRTLISSADQVRSTLALHRKTRTQRAASKTDQTALLLWQAAVLKKSEQQSIATTFDRTRFGAEALRALARLSAKPGSPVKALEALHDHGIAAVVLPSLQGTFLDGAAMVAQSGTPVIGLTLRHDRLDSFWFTVLHEAAHISLHYDHLLDSGAAFIDDMEIRSKNTFECEADALARESLIPSSILSQVPWDINTTYDELVTLSVRARVHISVAAGRWQRDHQNYRKFSRLIERGTIRAQLSRATSASDTIRSTLS